MGNDVEDDTTPAPVVREVVKNSGSSKKTDAAPASADPSKAKKKAKVTGNEGAFKNKTNNKTVAGPSSTPSKHSKKPFDKHSRTGKTDSAKKLKQGWGSNDKRELTDETAASEDATEEAAEEESTEEASIESQKKSLQDYFAELELKKNEFNAIKKTARTVAPVEGEKIEKEQANYLESTQAKKLKSKAQKEKKFLDIDAKFADDVPQTPKTFNKDSRKPTRGRGGKQTTSTRKPAAAKKPVVNDKNFPSL